MDVLTKDDALKRFKDGCQDWYSVKRQGEEEVYKCVWFWRVIGTRN